VKFLIGLVSGAVTGVVGAILFGIVNGIELVEIDEEPRSGWTRFRSTYENAYPGEWSPWYRDNELDCLAPGENYEFEWRSTDPRTPAEVVAASYRRAGEAWLDGFRLGVRDEVEKLRERGIL
jgi:hypothetical protein